MRPPSWADATSSENSVASASKVALPVVMESRSVVMIWMASRRAVGEGSRNRAMWATRTVVGSVGRESAGMVSNHARTSLGDVRMARSLRPWNCSARSRSSNVGRKSCRIWMTGLP